MPRNSTGKKVLGRADFVDVIDEHGAISSVPKAWVGTRLLPKGTKEATEENVRIAKAKDDPGGQVDVDQLRADVEAEVAEEHEKALAERDERIAELEQQLEEATKEPEGDGDKSAGAKS